jgi:hypothetical protein
VRPLVFVCGPLNADSPQQVAAHVLTAQAATVQLVALGCAPYCPHQNLGFALGVIPEADAEDVNQVFLDLADAVFVLPGWSRSFGSRREIASARASRKPIFFSPEEVSQWMTSRRNA